MFASIISRSCVYKVFFCLVRICCVYFLLLAYVNKSRQTRKCRGRVIADGTRTCKATIDMLWAFNRDLKTAITDSKRVKLGCIRGCIKTLFDLWYFDSNKINCTYFGETNCKLFCVYKAIFILNYSWEVERRTDGFIVILFFGK